MQRCNGIPGSLSFLLHESDRKGLESDVRIRAKRVRVMTSPAAYQVSHLDALEAESIFVMREVVAEMERPVLLFSGGKDSIVMLRLAQKAFAPANIPFPVMHVDTGHNFPEVLEYRDQRVAELGLQLIVASVPEALAKGLVRESADGMRNRIQTPVLLDVDVSKCSARTREGAKDGMARVHRDERNGFRFRGGCLAAKT